MRRRRDGGERLAAARTHGAGVDGLRAHVPHVRAQHVLQVDQGLRAGRSSVQIRMGCLRRCLGAAAQSPQCAPAQQPSCRSATPNTRPFPRHTDTRALPLLLAQGSCVDRAALVPFEPGCRAPARSAPPALPVCRCCCSPPRCPGWAGRPWRPASRWRPAGPCRGRWGTAGGRRSAPTAARPARRRPAGSACGRCGRSPAA